MIRRPPRSTLSSSSAASDVYKRQVLGVDGHQLPWPLHRSRHQRPADHQGLLVGEREGAAGSQSGKGRSQADRTSDPVQHDVGARTGQLRRGVGPGKELWCRPAAAQLGPGLPHTVNGCRLGKRWTIVAVAGLLILVFSIWPIIVWLASTDTLTTRRLISRRGVFSREGKDIPIDRVQSVSYRRTLLERMLGCGTLVVQTPATAATWSSPTSH